VGKVHTCAHNARHYAALIGAKHGPYGWSIFKLAVGPSLIGICSYLVVTSMPVGVEAYARRG